MNRLIRACLLVGLAVLFPVLAQAATMQCSLPNTGYQGYTGARYTSDGAGVITAVAANDVAGLTSGGCQQVGVTAGLIGRLQGANMNATSDQQIPLFATKAFRITKIVVTNATVSLTTAAGGVYPAASKGGTAIVAAGQVYTGLTGPTLALNLTIVTAPGNTYYPSTQPVFLALTTPQGAAATADVMVYGDVGQ